MKGQERGKPGRFGASKRMREGYLLLRERGVRSGRWEL